MEATPQSPPAVPDMTEVDKIDLLRRVGIVGYLVAVGTGVLVTFLPGIEARSHRPMLILAGIELVLAFVLIWGRRLPAWTIKGMVIDGGVLFTSAAVGIVHPLGATNLFYVWPAMNVAYFGDRPYVRRIIVLFVTTFAAALAIGQSLKVALAYYSATLSVFLVLIVVTAALVRRAEDLREQLQRAAAIDDLTGLLNRGALRVAFEREVQRAQHSGLALSVVIFDLDHFKLVNDALGHAAGDAALQRFAEVLQDASRPADLAARMGGEEFTVVLFDTDEAGARGFAGEVAARLRE